MATHMLTRAGTDAPAALGPRIRGALRRLPAWLRALDALRRERAELAALDDRILRDIGVTRADVDEALARPEAHRRLVFARHALDQL